MASTSSSSSSRRPAAGAILAPVSLTTATATTPSTPWGLLCILLLLFGVSFGCNDGVSAAFQFFPVAPLESSAATDALTLVSGRTRFLGGSAANDAVGYRPSTHTQQLRRHAAAMVVRPPIDSSGLVVGNAMILRHLGPVES
ncbi:hypothetical protein PG996_008563 [Apiospora saccharicola]|uniref:Uncharacterized protein n=1 Tax=Apiospora saccharicola TaxID=335842 RepID=A0ABR1UY96_9PEZI